MWAETWNAKKVIDLLHSWGKPAALNYTRLTPRLVLVLVLATVKRPSDLTLLRITPGVMQVTADLVTFQPVFGARNTWPNHPYGSTITLTRSEDECLCPVAVVKEYLDITKDREQRGEKLFVTRQMAPALFNAMIAN